MPKPRQRSRVREYWFQLGKSDALAKLLDGSPLHGIDRVPSHLKADYGDGKESIMRGIRRKQAKLREAA